MGPCRPCCGPMGAERVSREGFLGCFCGVPPAALPGARCPALTPREGRQRAMCPPGGAARQGTRSHRHGRAGWGGTGQVVAEAAVKARSGWGVRQGGHWRRVWGASQRGSWSSTPPAASRVGGGSRPRQPTVAAAASARRALRLSASAEAEMASGGPHSRARGRLRPGQDLAQPLRCQARAGGAPACCSV